MRNILLVFKREYLERVRKKSFLVMTVLVPAIMFGSIYIPIKFAGKNGLEKRTVTIVAPTQELAESVKQRLLEMVSHDNDPFNSTADKKAQSPYTVNTSTATDDAAKQELRNEV